MTDKLINSHPWLSQFFDYEFLIKKDKLSAGLLSSIAFYTDRYQIVKIFNPVVIQNHPLFQLMQNFWKIIQGSKDRINNFMNENATMALAQSIEQKFSSFRKNPKIFQAKVFITIANIFGVVFKVFSDECLKVYGSLSNSSIIIYIYSYQQQDYILFPIYYNSMNDDFLQAIQFQKRDVSHCGHGLDRFNKSAGVCGGCSEGAYNLEKKMIAKIGPIPAVAPAKPALNLQHKNSNPGNNPQIAPDLSSQNNKKCQGCQKSKKNQCKHCKMFFCDNHKPVDFCLVCGGGDNFDIILDLNIDQPIPVPPGPPITTHDPVSPIFKNPVSAQPTNPPIQKPQFYFDSFQNQVSTKFLKKCKGIIINRDILSLLLKAFMSSDSTRNNLKIQSSSNKPKGILRQMQKTINDAIKITFDEIIHAITSEFNTKYSNQYSPHDFMQVLDLTYLISCKLKVFYNRTYVKLGPDFGNNKWWFAFIDTEEKKATTYVESENKNDTEKRKKIDKRIENKSKEIDENNGKMVYLVCGCIYDKNEIFKKSFIELMKFKCSKHNLKLTLMELKIIRQNYIQLNEGCWKCLSINQNFIKCNFCTAKYCDEECSNNDSEKFKVQNGILICIVCQNKMKNSGLSNNHQIKIFDYEKELMITGGESVLLSIDLRYGYCNKCKNFPADSEGICKICKKE